MGGRVLESLATVGGPGSLSGRMGPGMGGL